MLMALGFRGVSFEFRFQTVRWRRFWDLAFACGSVTAALCQGLILGGAVQGVAYSGDYFTGGQLDFLSPFSIICGLAVVFAHVSVGSAWLIHKVDAPMRAFAVRGFRVSSAALGVASAAVFAGAIIVQPVLGGVWAIYGDWLMALAVCFYALLVRAWMRAGRLIRLETFRTVAAAFACVLIGMWVCLRGTVIPFRMTLLDGSSPTASEAFFVIGAAVVLPVILGYTALSYRVFRGPVQLPETL
jgi:cytochrome d ubiquinol oxidase subunit II